MPTSVQYGSRVDSPDVPTTHQPINMRDDDEPEATELGPVQHGPSDTVVNSTSIGETSASNVGGTPPILGGLRRWWKHYVQLHVPHADCRDHLGMSILDLILFTGSHPHSVRQS
jgi:hypothetical protein